MQMRTIGDGVCLARFASRLGYEGLVVRGAVELSLMARLVISRRADVQNNLLLGRSAMSHRAAWCFELCEGVCYMEGHGLGLKALVAMFLGKRLGVAEQVSDWNGALTDAQLRCKHVVLPGGWS